jgi:hypothetical protein
MNAYILAIYGLILFFVFKNTGHFSAFFDTICICGVLFCWLGVLPSHSMAQAFVDLLPLH